MQTDFNAEIKALNKHRAAFGDKTLKEQIKQLDRLMEKLDRRVEKLQQLETRTTFKAAVKDTIKTAASLTARASCPDQRHEAQHGSCRSEKRGLSPLQKLCRSN